MALVLNTEVVRKMTREELEEALSERGVTFEGKDYGVDDFSDDELRDKLMNHEAAQACPFWEEAP